ncbi:hypothetical protein DE146DRAFT_661025 [Phaeosphaeria sp. MPI-PUGE-AT-0046c]|nr:hypothetical protein DE146DRAFT_661025 [Phaeosphaeria sp. MPI-PUGE-AT-0046c]
MKLTTASALVTTLSLASASPCNNPFPRPTQPSDVFRLISIRSGSELQYGNVQAKDSSFYINAPSQNSSCSNPDTNYASFTLSDAGDLYLYTDFPPTQAVVDRSGMGQGVIQYTTGVAPQIGRNSERGPFVIDDAGNLVFGGGADGASTGFQACPGAVGGGWSLWLTGVEKPAGNEGCLGINLKAVKEEEAVKCLYT